MSWSEEDLAAFLRERNQAAFNEAQLAVKRSKYRNVKVTIDGDVFDSKREAAFWQTLKLREKAGHIVDLRRQVAFPLYAPVIDDTAAGASVQVSTYIADFVYRDAASEQLHIVDAKGHRTQMYRLKAKWLELQQGIVIEEV